MKMIAIIYLCIILATIIQLQDAEFGTSIDYLLKASYSFLYKFNFMKIKWMLAGIDTSIDSFYEYLLKACYLSLQVQFYEDQVDTPNCSY
ncbi:hypothetical protein M6B38_187380 [Iris pallida]|uniref:Uncharacterized protein n=1 Tax=Iris pallida TaxID=29817 RepID=A0AAX6EJS3_IRIPA|nr:hypothetical protein M6B38_187380 [Iris pallida]